MQFSAVVTTQGILLGAIQQIQVAAVVVVVVAAAAVVVVKTARIAAAVAAEAAEAILEAKDAQFTSSPRVVPSLWTVQVSATLLMLVRFPIPMG